MFISKLYAYSSLITIRVMMDFLFYPNKIDMAQFPVYQISSIILEVFESHIIVLQLLYVFW